MEIAELLSLHIAVPVVCVIVCALGVFAFGFRSPVQPPSFNFEEEKRGKRRVKQTKSKGPINGYVATNEPSSEPVSKPATKPAKEVKTVAAVKEKVTESKIVARKEMKQEINGDKKKKTKKEVVTEEVKAESGKKSKALLTRKETEDDGEWTTIQVSKKSKKQKPTSRRDGGQAESAVEAESEPETPPAPVSDAAAAASPVVTSEVEESNSPQINKRKKKKDKSTGKIRAEDKEELPIVSVIEKPELASDAIAQTQDLGDSKRKKNKKDKKSSIGSDAAAASASENIQDAASASGKTGKKESSPPPAAEPIFAQVAAPAVDEQARVSPKKKKSKGKDNLQEDKTVRAAEVPLKQVERHVEPVRKDTDIQLKEVEKPSEPVKKETEKKKTKSISKVSASKVEPELASNPVSVEASGDTAESAAANQASVGLSFDEIGDSWQEAAPKSKKKKPRRDN